MATEEVVAGRLILVHRFREELPENVAEVVADRKLSKVGKSFVGNGIVVNGDHQFGEESEGVADASFWANVVAAEERRASGLCFELEVEEFFD